MTGWNGAGMEEEEGEYDGKLNKIVERGGRREGKG